MTIRQSKTGILQFNCFNPVGTSECAFSLLPLKSIVRL